ncbi:hypothetical protein DRN63_00455 [Nanoarchaeota archaeon]|nr:MAG: hypothetical protein DRN63_00455 [Nanoarchaeota archaeon]
MPRKDWVEEEFGYFKALRWLLFSRFLSFFFMFFTSLVIARILGPHNWGILSIASAIVLLLYNISTLGLNAALVYFIPRLRGGKLKLAILWTTKVRLVFSLLLGSLLLLGSDFIADFYRIKELALVLKIMAVEIPIDCLAFHFYSVLQGFRRFGKVALWEFLRSSSKFIPLALTLSFSLLGAAMGYAIISLPSLLISGFWITRLLPKGKARDKISKQILKYGSSMLIATLASFFSAYASNAVVGYFGAKEAGFFSASLQICIALATLPQVITSFLVPTISKAHHKKRDYLKIVERYGKYILLYQIPAMIGVLFLRREILIFFGSRYLKGVDTLGILAISYCFFGSLGYLFHSIALGIGRSDLSRNFNLVRAAANLIFLFALVPWLYSEGAALASLFSSLISIFYLAYALKLKQKFHLMITKKLANILLSTFLMMILLYFVVSPVSRPILRILISLTLGASSYFLFMWLTGELKKEDLRVLKHFLGF